MAEIRFERVTKRFKDGTIAVNDLSLAVRDGEFMILVGPSGCGKTTALRMVAGLEDLTDGQITLGDQVVDDLEPGDRDVAMVFQNYALFPHMTVGQNIAFPLRARRFSKSEIRSRVLDTATLLGLQKMLARKPHELSGGQRQRVAMGRAIVRHPQAFLLDEPLSNLDAKLRTQMRAELAKLHRRLGVTTLYVTHDQTEAMTLGARVAVLRDGVMQQVGAPQDLYWKPANAFVGRFIGSPGMNLLSGFVEDGVLRVAAAPLSTGGADISGIWDGTNRDVLIGFRPQALRAGSPDAGADAVAVTGVVEVVENLGSETLVYLSHDAWTGRLRDQEGDSTDSLAGRLDEGQVARPGDAVTFHVDVRDLYLFAADTEEALVAPSAREPAGNQR